MLNIILEANRNQIDPIIIFFGFVIALIILFFWFSRKKNNQTPNSNNLKNSKGLNKSEKTDNTILKNTEIKVRPYEENSKDSNEILLKNITKELHNILVNSYLFFFNTEPNKETMVELMIYSQYHILRLIHLKIRKIEHDINKWLNEYLENFIDNNNVSHKLPCPLDDFIDSRYKIYALEFQNLSNGPSIPINIIRNIYNEPFQFVNITMDEVDFEKTMKIMIDFGMKNNEFLNKLENTIINLSYEVNKNFPNKYDVNSLEILKDNSYEKAEEYFIKGSYIKMITKDFKGAIEDFSKAIDINNKYYEAYFKRGIAKFNIEDFMGAIEDFSNALVINPKYEKAYRMRGLTKEKIKDYNGAIKDYTKVIEIYPSKIEEYIQDSEKKAVQSDYNGSFDDLDEAFELDSEVSFAYAGRGICKCILEQKENGRLDFIKASEYGYKKTNELIEKYC